MLPFNSSIVFDQLNWRQERVDIGHVWCVLNFVIVDGYFSIAISIASIPSIVMATAAMFGCLSVSMVAGRIPRRDGDRHNNDNGTWRFITITSVMASLDRVAIIIVTI